MFSNRRPVAATYLFIDHRLLYLVSLRHTWTKLQKKLFFLQWVTLKKHLFYFSIDQKADHF